jgi:ketosteroid isomerase-like protein
MENTMTKLIASTAAALALCAAVSARADDKAEISSLYQKLETALKTQKYEATLGLETPDFVSTDAQGKKSTGKQMVEDMKKQNMGGTTVKEMSIKLQSVAISGKSAKVTTSFTYDVQVTDSKGNMGPKGKTHIMAMKGSVKNDLLKTAAGWKFKTMQMSPTSMMMDGKPYNPGAGAPHAGGGK